MSLKRVGFGIAERLKLLWLLQKATALVTARLYVLAYHRVDTPDHRPWLNPGLISATPEQFETQMRLIARNYHPISANDLLNAIAKSQCLPRDSVLVTVDDGYLDFQEFIYPITKQYHIRPILFVPTSHVGKGWFWWDQLYQAIYLNSLSSIDTPIGIFSLQKKEDREQAEKQLSYYLKHIPWERVATEMEAIRSAANITFDEHRSVLNWEELRSLDQAGVTIAAHTHTHPMLTHMPITQAEKEVNQSQIIIQQEIGHSAPIFAFPDGKADAFTPEIINLLKAQGFQTVFTMIDGCINFDRVNFFCLPRLGVWSKLDLGQFHWHLTPLHHQERI